MRCVEMTELMPNAKAMASRVAIGVIQSSSHHFFCSKGCRFYAVRIEYIKRAQARVFVALTLYLSLIRAIEHV